MPLVRYLYSYARVLPDMIVSAEVARVQAAGYEVCVNVHAKSFHVNCHYQQFYFEREAT